MGVELARQPREPAEVRREKIMELAHSQGFIRPGDIARHFKVSDETGRRDIASLSDAGRLTRVHGGAMVLEEASAKEPERRYRAEDAVERKRDIGRLAAEHVRRKDTVFFDVGTTVEAAAEALPADFCGTVVTTSLIVACAVGRRPHVSLHVAGGRMRPGEFTIYGPDALQYLASFRADIAFIGCGAVDVESGVSDFAPEDVPLKRAMIGQSQRAFVLATAEKLGRTATRIVCPLASVSGVIVDRDADPIEVRRLERAGALVEVPVTESVASSA